MTVVKTPQELEIMREGGEKLGGILRRLLAEVKVGVVPLQIDNLAKDLIREAGGSPSFMTVPGYKWATCISVNEGVVHGVPTEEPFQSGDLVSLDVGLLYKGYHTDTSWSVYLRRQTSDVRHQKEDEIERFLKTGEEALKRAISQVRMGNHIGHISQAIQETIEGNGYRVVESLVGHGVGKKLHEPPQVPGILTKQIPKTPEIQSGMVLAIEVIYTMGRPEITLKNKDGWTLVTADGSLAGLFEQTVAVTQKQTIVLTQR